MNNHVITIQVQRLEPRVELSIAFFGFIERVVEAFIELVRRTKWRILLCQIADCYPRPTMFRPWFQ